MKRGHLTKHTAVLMPILILSLAVPGATAPAALSPAQAKDRDLVVHALGRLGYGPRPGDVERVIRLGLDAWLDQQLHPERVPDSAVTAHLAALPTVRLSSSELLKRYDVPREAKAEAKKKLAEQGDSASEEETRKARREVMQKYRGEMDGTPRQVVEELQAAKLVRAIHSERQLDEVLVDFWMNHFNVYAQKGADKFLVGEYEREVIRPYAWGRFEDLLKATAESPAMLFYLDNWLSADPKAVERALGERTRRNTGGGGRRQGAFGRQGRRVPAGDPETMRPGEGAAPKQGAGRRRGLNENYAREIMELHTLGVEGGYTQKDVTEVARCLTGWTIEGLRQQQPRFTFENRLHDRGDKVVLGRTIKAGGKDEGEAVIHMLATHPSTARFLSLKLARRFVADEPPPALVDRAAETFRKTGGDIRAVVTTIVRSPEFSAAENRAAKVKTPLEFVVSAVRAAGATVTDARDLARRVGEMGMPLYLQQPPTGYKDVSEAWVSTSGLLARLNFALDLTSGRVRGTTVDVARLASAAEDTDGLSGALAAALVPGGLSPSTLKTLEGETGNASNAPRVAGLIFGSPEFQRR